MQILIKMYLVMCLALNKRPFTKERKKEEESKKKKKKKVKKIIKKYDDQGLL